MKNKVFLAIAALALLCVVGFTQTPQKPAQFEYKIEFNINEKKLNALASQGWELVAVSPDASVGNVTASYFRRVKQ
jgi:hypothetical protein